MKFSILTPSFNQASFLERNIRSVLNQDVPDVEHLIFDGNSTDDTVNILKRYSDRLAFWVSEPDEGQADALAKALSKSNGDIIGWLNVDEFYDANIFGSVRRAFEENPDAVVVYGNCRLVTPLGKQIRINRQWRFDFDVCRIQTPIMISCSTFFRRDRLVACGGFDRSWNYSMDWELFIRYMRDTPSAWVRVRKVLGNYTMHLQSKTATSQSGFIAERERLLDREFPGVSSEERGRLQQIQTRRMKWHMLMDGVLFGKVWFKVVRQRHFAAYYGDPGVRVRYVTPLLEKISPTRPPDE
ncbi:MAG TPA: glycosyltransferase family 2 protein [Tepidisphaeraceae bacterium]|nr:glycosyltransferase family 2 protein [Tepidisphaeraceae bacterium]